MSRSSVVPLKDYQTHIRQSLPHAFKMSTRIIETSTRGTSVYLMSSFNKQKTRKGKKIYKMVVTVYFRIFDYFQISPTMNTGTVSAMIFASRLIILQFFALKIMFANGSRLHKTLKLWRHNHSFAVNNLMPL